MLWQKDKVFGKYYNATQAILKEYLRTDFENLRNQVIHLTRKSKGHFYEMFFENNNGYAAKIWKGIKQLIL